jgi:hypothetical protein
MKRTKLWIMLGLSTGALGMALLAVPQGASAATTHGNPAAAHVTSSAHVTTGHRPVSRSTSTEGAYPRLNLNGCSRQDGFNGTVTWATVPGSYVELAGNLWDVCGAPVQVWVSWYSPTYHNEEAYSVPAYGNQEFDWLAFTTLNPGRIQVTVCGSWRGVWTCGSPYKV